MASLPIKLLDSEPQTDFPGTETQCTCYGASLLGEKHILYGPFGENAGSLHMDFSRFHLMCLFLY